VKQCFRELYLHTRYRRFGFRQHCLRLKRTLERIKGEAQIQMRYRDKFLAIHNHRRKDIALKIIHEYAKRKIFESKNAAMIKATKLIMAK